MIYLLLGYMGSGKSMMSSGMARQLAKCNNSFIYSNEEYLSEFYPLPFDLDWRLTPNGSVIVIDQVDLLFNSHVYKCDDTGIRRKIAATFVQGIKTHSIIMTAQREIDGLIHPDYITVIERVL